MPWDARKAVVALLTNSMPLYLNTLERQAKLCMNVLDEGSDVLVHLRLTLHGERPAVVAEIIKNDKII